ncbi:MAG: M48 family metallopeptidase [Myxococcota bacterium]
MIRSRNVALVAGLGALAVVACHKVPYTGRVQYNLVPDSIMRGVGQSSYQSTLSDSKVEKTGEDHDILVKVGNKISKVANQPDYEWKYSLIQDDATINAWCMPGGYIAFYTGILPVLQHEAGMAFVMGHEVGHATAHHGAERLSQQLTLIGGLAGLELYMASSTKIDAKAQAAILAALGVGAELGVILPFSRTHESEADVIGLMYMAQAGYPPKESIPLWDRMSVASPGSIPVFLSTHPSNDARQANLKEWMPQATKKFERSKLPYDTTKVEWAGLGSGNKAGQHP